MTRLPVAILAGGLGTRLGSFSHEAPKCLMEVAGRPFIHHQLRQLQGQGVRRVVLCVGHLGEMVVNSVGDGSAFDLEVVYSFDGPTAKGTGGAIKRALPVLGAAFFALYGDSYLQCDYAAIEKAHEASGKHALMTVYRNQGQWDSSNVEFHDGRIFAYDKVHRTERMSYIDYGLGAFNQQAFNDRWDDVSFDLAEVYRQMLSRGELAGFEVRERFYEIGSVVGLEETRQHLAGLI